MADLRGAAFVDPNDPSVLFVPQAGAFAAAEGAPPDTYPLV
jgi:hypothetical protein